MFKQVEKNLTHSSFFMSALDLVKINLEAKNNALNLVCFSESFFYSQIEKVCKEICRVKPKIVLLSGPSASGKTTTANLIQKNLYCKYSVSSIVVSLDDFFLNPEFSPVLPDGSPDLENFSKLDISLINKFLEEMIVSGKSKMPNFNFKTGRRGDEFTNIELPNEGILIVEGTHALNPKLIKLENLIQGLFKIYITTNSHFIVNDRIAISGKTLRMMRRLIRDSLKRGESFGGFVEKWPKVLKGEGVYIEPFKQHADFMIDSVHFYEPMLYATYLKEKFEKEIYNNQCILKELYEVSEVLTHLEQFETEIIPCSSMLWEVF